MRDIIEVEHLVKQFNGLLAINDVSFGVREGEVFGFLGPNGAGKTTTINILCTLLKPTSGRAMLNGFDVSRDQEDVRMSIGLVFQDPSLDIKLSAMQNLEFHAGVYNMPRSLSRPRIEQMLKMVDLWDRRKDTVHTFSGGMRRRLEIARGLLHHPRVLFLDEPTLGLDPQTRSYIWEHILDIRKQENVTVFLTTHYMDEATVADRIAVIDHGKIIALDTPAGLKRMVGGDIITLTTQAPDAAIEEIGLKHNIEAHRDAEGVSFEIENGEEFIPTLLSDFKSGLQSISLRRPTLDDVFMKLTGREIREEAGGVAVMKKHFGIHQTRMGGGRFH